MSCKNNNMEKKYLVKNINHFGDLNQMRLAGQLCDVTIKVNGREFAAHKNVLASNLKYFKSMFLNDGFLENKLNVVTMEDLEEKYLALILNFAYTGELLVTDNNALGLLEIGNYLNEDIIKEECINFLEKHLDKSDACRAYQFANATNFVPLKATARSRILSNFEYCSQTAEYFDFDCESLKAIISIGINWYPQSQQSFFEGLINWILHDVRNRKIYVKDLLYIINMSKLASDYMIQYFCSLTRDHSDIASEIMSIYNDKILSPTNQEEIRLNDSLMIVGLEEWDHTLKLHFYDLTEQKLCEEKWCKIMDLNLDHTFDTYTTFHSQFFYTVYRKNATDSIVTDLHVFDLLTKQNKTLTSTEELLSESAMCASTEMIYFFGGKTVDDKSVSDQVVKYDPRTNHFEALAPMRVKRACSAAIFYQGYILVLGGCDETKELLHSVEKYDPSTNQWMTFPSMLKPRHGFKVAILNGKLYACCGDKSHSFEVYDPSTNSWNEITAISGIMHYDIIIVHEGKLVCNGYKRKNVTLVYDPINNRQLMDEKLSEGIPTCALGGVLVPSSYVN